MVIWMVLSCALACNLPDLPPTIDFLSPSFSHDGTLDSSGRFISSVQSYEISIQKDSWIRVSTTPNLHTISLSISSYLTTFKSSAASQQRAIIAGKLPKGQYKFSIDISEISAELETIEDDCKQPTVYLAFAVMPMDSLGDFKSDKRQEEFPDISRALEAFESGREVEQTFETCSIPVKKLGDRVLKSYLLSVPDKETYADRSGTTGLWEITFSLHANFAVAGGLGLMLNRGKKAPKTYACPSGKCLFGRLGQKNAITLHSVLSEGNYTLSIFYDLSEGESEMLKAIENIIYTPHLKLSQVIEREDRFNCDAARLPSSLNSFMDSEGFMRYSEWIFADLFVKKHSSTFKLNKASVFRITTIEPSGLDVDILLISTGGRIAETNQVGGSEGILAEIDSGDYSIEISFLNSFFENTRHQYCETVFIEIGVTPKSAAEAFVENYKLKECEDSTIELNEIFAGIKAKMEEKSFALSPGSSFFKLPLKSLSESNFKIYKGKFELPALTFAYFEIYSDFVMSDLSINLVQKVDKKTNIIFGTEDALELSEHGRKSFHGELKAGEYSLIIYSAPSAQISEAADDDYKSYYKSADYKTVPKCAAFQLKIHLAPATEESLNEWSCRKTEFKFLPNTLNTIDRLGIKNTPQSALHSTILYSSAFLAPNSNNKAKNNITFYIETESVIRVFAESEDSRMGITLKQGNNVIKSTGTDVTSRPFIYSFSQTLEQHSSYKLEVSYYPATSQCNLYSLLLEIIPKKRLLSSDVCNEVKPGKDFVVERFMEKSDLFEFISENGQSSMTIEPSFQYNQNQGQYIVKLPLVITSESALVAGHLLSNFIQAGLALQIESESEIIDWGYYKSPYRYELDPITLNKGIYEITIQELSENPAKTCIGYSGVVLVQDVNYWNDISGLVKKGKTCTFPDQPESLNTIGQLQNGELRWHQTIQINLILQYYQLEFTLDQDSVIMIYIIKERGFEFEVSVTPFDKKDAVLKDKESLTGSLKPGKYFLKIYYRFLYKTPDHKDCIGFEADMTILPSSSYEKLAAQYTCKSSKIIPETLSPGTPMEYLQYGEIENTLKFALKENSKVVINIYYETALSGYISFQLYTASESLLKVSQGLYNWNSVTYELPVGLYLLKITSTKAYQATCWPLGLSFSASKSNSCLGSILPKSLALKSAAPFGGPQSEDGSLAFYGAFQIAREMPKEILEISAPSDCIIRVLTVSPGFHTESTVYRTPTFDTPIAYSSNKSKYTSFIFALIKQTEPFYLVLSHILKDTLSCLVFELKIEILSNSKVAQRLECGLNMHKSLLPSEEVDLVEGKISGSDGYAVFDKWMIGKDLPSGVVSKGLVNTAFMYRSLINVPKNGVMSIQSTYDFLTNDLYLEIVKDKKLVAMSQWMIVDTPEGGVFGSSIEGLKVTKGKYIVQIRQGIASNHLVQRYPDISICFPFSFFIEYSADATEEDSTDTEDEKIETTNPLVFISPPQLSDHNSLTSLYIVFQFSRPVEASNITNEMLYLNSESGKVRFSEIIKSTEDELKVRAKFSSKDLRADTCYELKFDDRALKNDGNKHEYCTSKCKCNPKANALCTNGICSCHPPYTGTTCFDCIEDYESIKNSCMEIVDKDPRVTSASINIDNLLKLSDTLELTVTFSSAPYLNQGEKITNVNAESLINTFSFASNTKFVKPSSATSEKNSQKTWKLKFASEDFEFSKSYSLQAGSGLIYTSSGTEFSLKGLPSLKFEVEAKPIPKNSVKTIECIHGTLKDTACVCNTGYTGPTCGLCLKGYKLNSDDLCEKLPEKIQVDNSADIISISLTGLSSIIHGEQISIELELSQQPYTPQGFIIDSLTNQVYIQKAFALKTKSSKPIPPEIKALDKKGLRWLLEFDTTPLIIDKTYRLVQLDNFLFTIEGKMFDQSSLDLPKFKILVALDCEAGKQVNDICVCNSGYEGTRCEKCAEGYSKNLNGDCLIIQTDPIQYQSTDPGYLSNITYLLGFSAVAIVIIYFINSLRKPSASNRQEFELSSRERESEIDLYK